MIISTAVNMDKSPEVELKFKNVIESERFWLLSLISISINTKI